MNHTECILCRGEIREIASNPEVSYCERCKVYQIPQGFYMDLSLNISHLRRKRRIRRASSLTEGINTLAELRRELESASQKGGKVSRETLKTLKWT